MCFKLLNFRLFLSSKKNSKFPNVQTKLFSLQIFSPAKQTLARASAMLLKIGEAASLEKLFPTFLKRIKMNTHLTSLVIFIVMLNPSYPNFFIFIQL